LGRPRVAQARLRLGHRGGLAARASDARRSLGYRTRRDRGEPHRCGRRAPLVWRPGGRCPRAARRTHRRGLLRDRAARSSNRRDLALRNRRVRGGRRGARPARAGPQHAAGGVRATRLDGVRCDGCGTDADRPHWNELRAAPLPRHDGERRGPRGTGGATPLAWVIPANHEVPRPPPLGRRGSVFIRIGLSVGGGGGEPRNPGAAARVGLTSEELALACASHSSEPDQVARVRELLGKIGCSERDLLCGPHPPLSDRVAQDYQTRGLRLTAVYSNCSGKHAGMLALARHHGWPTEFYTRLEHPVQQRCLAEVSRWTEVGVGDIRTAVDGCGVVCYGLPLRNMALAYARLAKAERGTRNAEDRKSVVE